MIKLETKETDNYEMYISVVPYSETTNGIVEDMIQPDDIIMTADNYNDILDTRLFIGMYLKPIASDIKNLPYVNNAWVRKASKKTEKGLSNYIDIVFKHPNGITKGEIKEGYTYSIRFSEHKTAKKDNLIYCVDMVGMKPKKFEKKVNNILKKHIDIVQDKITEYEISHFGEKKTTLV